MKMKSIVIAILVFISGCTQVMAEKAEGIDGEAWDFDHKVKFHQIKKSENLYNLTIRSTSKTRFSTISTFLVRKSFDLCKGYGFKIEILKGIETYNDEKYIKSYIPASLEANIECPAK